MYPVQGRLFLPLLHLLLLIIGGYVSGLVSLGNIWLPFVYQNHAANVILGTENFKLLIVVLGIRKTRSMELEVSNNCVVLSDEMLMIILISIIFIDSSVPGKKI